MADPQGIGEPSRAEPVIAELRFVSERLLFCKRLLPVDRRRQEPTTIPAGALCEIQGRKGKLACKLSPNVKVSVQAIPSYVIGVPNRRV
jgi:hypothetical protein